MNNMNIECRTYNGEKMKNYYGRIRIKYKMSVPLERLDAPHCKQNIIQCNTILFRENV